MLLAENELIPPMDRKPERNTGQDNGEQRIANNLYQKVEEAPDMDKHSAIEVNSERVRTTALIISEEKSVVCLVTIMCILRQR